MGVRSPLILLAARPKEPGESKYEIIDGVQRLNAIFSYIENAFHVGGKYFDVKEFTRAKLVVDQGLFSRVSDDKPLLSQKECADLLDYQLAITIYPASSENDITDVFGRINSGGRQLSAQEKRQAGVITPFTEMVRKILYLGKVTCRCQSPGSTVFVQWRSIIFAAQWSGASFVGVRSLTALFSPTLPLNPLGKSPSH